MKVMMSGTSSGVAGLIRISAIGSLDSGLWTLFIHGEVRAVEGGDLALRVVVEDRYPVAGALGVTDGRKPDQHVTSLLEVVFRPDSPVHPRRVFLTRVIDEHAVRHHV